MSRPPEEWVSLYLEGRIPAGEEAAFNAWLQSDPENLELLAQQLDLHGSLKAKLQKEATRATGRIRMARKGRRTRRDETRTLPRTLLWAAAGILAALTILPFVWESRRPVKPAPDPLTRREAPPVEPEPTPVPPPEPEPLPEPPPKLPDPLPKVEAPEPPKGLPAPTPVPKVPEPAPPKQDRTIVSIAELRDLRGEVLVGKAPARTGVAAGETVETLGKDSSAVVVFPDGTRVELRGETEVRDLAPKRLFLARGALEARVTKQVSALIFDTPQAEAKVLGTTLRLQVDAKGTLLEVDEGKVRLTRTSDQKAVDVVAGTFALASELKLKPLPKATVLLAFDFEDAAPPGVQVGKVAPGPKRPGNRGCLEGVEVPADRVTRVLFADDRSGLFAVRDGAVLTFDYWAAGRVEAIDVYVWDKTQRASIGGPSLLTPVREKWTRATIPFSEFVSTTGLRIQDGDVLTQLTIQTGGTNGGGPLFVDNVEVVRKK